MEDYQEKLDNLDPVAAYYYEDLSKHAKPLSRSEEKVIVARLQASREAFKAELNSLEEVKAFFRDRFNFLTSRPGGSAAKMSEYYNSKKKGRNQRLTKKITQAINSKDTKDFAYCNFKFSLYEEAFSSIQYAPEECSRLNDLIKQDEHILISSVLRLINKLAIRHALNTYGMDKKDLIQAGNEGAIKAAHLYKPGKCRFNTFAYYKIKSAIQRYIMENSRLVSLPIGKVTTLLLVLQVSNSLPDNLKSNSSILAYRCSKLAKRKVSRKEVEEALINLSGHVDTIDAPLSPTSSNHTAARTLGEALSDPSVDIEEEASYNLIADSTKKHLYSLLEPMEADALYYKFFTPEKIEDLKLSKNKLNALEKEAFKKLKKSTWFWKRFSEETLSKILTPFELEVLWAQRITPKLQNEDMKSWGEVAKLLNCNPHKVISAYRATNKKLAKGGIDLET